MIGPNVSMTHRFTVCIYVLCTTLFNIIMLQYNTHAADNYVVSFFKDIHTPVELFLSPRLKFT